MQDGSRDPGEERRAQEDVPPLPSSLIPRWLAALVLVALLSAGAATAWIVLSY